MNLGVVQTLYGGRHSRLPLDGGRKKNETWNHYDDSLYRIIQEIFINLIVVKFIDSSPLRQPHLLSPFSTDDSCDCACCKYFFTFYNKAWTLSMPWGRVSCTCMATSVAMVICACSPHLMEPLHRGSL